MQQRWLVPVPTLVLIAGFVLPSGAHGESVNTKASPDNSFDKAAKRVLQTWSYWPRTVHAKPLGDCNVEESVAFKPGKAKQLVWVGPASG